MASSATKSDHDVAVRAAAEALRAAKAQFGPEHVKVAAAFVRLGRAWSGAGRYREAERAYRRSLSIAEKRLGPEHAVLPGVVLRQNSIWRTPDRNYYCHSFKIR